MAELHIVTGAELMEIQTLYLGILGELKHPQGSSIDPGQVVRALKKLRAAARSNPLPQITGSFDSDDFLYLSLPIAMLLCPIRDLNFSVRTFNCLKREEIHTLGDLLERSAAELQDIRNFGKKCLDEVVLKLKGIKFKGKELHLSWHDQGLEPPPGDEWVALNDRIVLRSRLALIRVAELKSDGLPDAWRVIDVLSKRFEIHTVGELLTLSQADILAFDWASHWDGLGPEPDAQMLTPEAALACIKVVLAAYQLDIPDNTKSK